MRDYGQVQCSWWGHPDTASLDDIEKLLFLYLLTGPHSNGLGCYRIPFGYVSSDTGKDMETVSEAFKKMEAKGLIRYCEDTDFVHIINYMKWNGIANPKVAAARQKEFEAIPSRCKLIPEVAGDIIEHGKHFKEPFLYRLETVVRARSETVSKQEPNRTEPNRTFSCARDGSHVDAETGEILKWGGVQ